MARIAVFDTEEQKTAYYNLLDAAQAIADAFDGVNSESMVEAVMQSAANIINEQFQNQ